MLDILNYVCRGLVKSEDRIARLTKCVKTQNTMCLLLGVACLGLTKIVGDNARDIRELKSKIKTMEASDQEGA